MPLLRSLILLAVIITLVVSFAACKKKEPQPTAATGAETAKTAETVSVHCPKPGEDLICEECKTLFMTDEEYAAHMEKQHPDKWAKIKDEFWALRKGGTAAKPPK